MTSTLEDTFLFQVRALGLPEPEREVVAVPGRKFRFDFCFREARLLIEVNGGTFTRGGHSTGLGIRRDYEKANLAQLAGWRVLNFDGNAVKSGAAVEMVRKALEAE
jgi:very-short-patch-repair endonuclease